MSTATETPRRLDEQKNRRPDFRGGVPITLCDGQAWTLARPRISHFYFSKGPDGKTRMLSGFDFGDAYEDKVEAYIDAEPGVPSAVALAELAYHLLSLNYNLDLEYAAPLLLRVPADDPKAADVFAMWNAIASLALGQAADTDTAPDPEPAAV